MKTVICSKETKTVIDVLDGRVEINGLADGLGVFFIDDVADPETAASEYDFDAADAKTKLANTDTDRIRISEDLFDILLTKNIIEESDIPQDVLDKLNYAKMQRATIQQEE